MNKKGPIIVIEDDADDRDSIASVYNELGFENKLVFLEDGEKALKFLNTLDVVPFIIISDINMPKLDGLALRTLVSKNQAINFLCIPYIIFSTTTDKRFVDLAYSSGIQGYFQKPSSYMELKNTLMTIIGYWKKSRSPGNYAKI